MRHYGLVLALVLLGLVASMESVFAQSASEQTVSVLDSGEPFEGMAVVNSLLIVGSSRKDFAPNYKLQIFDHKQQLLSTLTLDHTAAFVYKYNNEAILVVGTWSGASATGYSIVNLKDGRNPQVKTHQIAESAWAYRWMGTIGNREVFSDPGGNQNDPERDRDYNLASQTLFMLANGTPQYLRSRIHLPLAGVAVGGGIFVVEGYGGQSVRDRILFAAPNASQVTPILANPPADLKELVLLGDKRTIAISDEAKDAVIFIDTASRQVISTVGVGPRPFSLYPAGKCVVVGDIEDRKIRVVHLQNGSDAKLIYTHAIASSESEFRLLTRVAADLEHGLIYARSNYACNPMTETCDQGLNRVLAIAGLELSRALDTCRIP